MVRLTLHSNQFVRAKRRMLLGGFAIAILGAIVWLISSSREPVYQGKTVREHLDQLAKVFANNRSFSSGRTYVEVKADDPVVKAIYACGPDAIPYLRRALRKHNGRAEKILTLLRTNLPTVMSKRLPPAKSDYLGGLREAAIRGLAPFGPAARDAVPDLIDCFHDIRARNMAYYAVTEIGLQSEHLPAL